jgi:hypothetical protein
MNFTADILPWITQGIMGAILLYLAFKKAPVERQTLDATTTAQYASAAKLKAEENAILQKEYDELKDRMDCLEKKKFKICIEFITGEPPEVLKAEVVPIEMEVPIKMVKHKK